jgi:hypothetical protein
VPNLSKNNRKNLEAIKSGFEQLIQSKGATGITIVEALASIKAVLEKTISTLGETGKTSLIRSQKPIKLIHEVIKTSLISSGINPENIKPRLGASSGELKLSGFLKKKDQDICIIPNGAKEVLEKLTVGLLAGRNDKFGLAATESIISINVRSQLSSLGNNIDTLYERIFAEAMNLHMRCPKMCLGEVYMIPVYEYHKHLAQKKQIGWVTKKSPIETYIRAFEGINLRTSITDDFYKYEKACLLVVDFSKVIPKLYSTDAELKADNLIAPTSTVSISNLNYQSFIKDLVATYSTRFPANTLT